jgi:exodeoxyribonuclease V alpha subunit
LEALVDSVLPIVEVPSSIEGGSASFDSIPNEAGRGILSQKLVALTGGPGTGKTYTMIRLIALSMWREMLQGGRLSVAVCAPTGKAAARALEALSSFVQQERQQPSPVFPAEVIDQFANIRPTTIHRLLGRRRNSRTRFAHNSSNRLPHQLIAVDESSMVSSQLMARLLEAIPEHCTLLIVGDEAQLESVESGSVLAEIVESRESIKGSVFTLNVNHRAGVNSPITALSHQIRLGDGRNALKLLQSGVDSPVLFPSDFSFASISKILDGALEILLKAREKASSQAEADHREALELVGSVKVLCGPRSEINRRGVAFWDEEISKRVLGKGSDLLSVGRPILITKNSPSTGLNNGDIGVVVRKNDQVQVAFLSVDGSIKYHSQAELPEFESSYAMTVHKSQGSEYTGFLIVVLPTEKSPLLVRELVYTAITRAKRNAVVRIVGEPHEFEMAVARRTRRTSGLSSLLRLARG